MKDERPVGFPHVVTVTDPEGHLDIKAYWEIAKAAQADGPDSKITLDFKALAQVTPEMVLDIDKMSGKDEYRGCWAGWRY